MQPLAIIESDAALSVEIRSAVESAGFRTGSFHDAASALAGLRQNRFSLAILGLDRHDADPIALCREASEVVPVIAITSRRGEETCVRALAVGADDCICRPIQDRELVARVRNVLRRAHVEEETHAGLAELSLSVAEMRVHSGDAVHDLSRGETEVLALLLAHAPKPLTSAQLAALLPAPRGTVESRIKSLRKKLGPERLVRRGGFGYQVV